MQSAERSLLSPVVKGMNDHTSNDEKYRITASPVTTSKFGPSGSLNRKNNVLEHTSAVIPSVSNDVFVDVKDIVVMSIILYNKKYSIPINFSCSRR
jgi:hypothetical protein